MRRSICMTCVATVCLLAAASGISIRAAVLPKYVTALTIGSGIEWRFRPLLTDLDGDGHPDLVATARLERNPLHVWLGEGNGNLTAMKPTWSPTGYAALATGDINRDGFPVIVSASHFGTVQTLLSSGTGAFSEKILPRDDGYIAAQLADINGDSLLDLVLVGYQKAGIEIYLGDGIGNWNLQRTLPDPLPGQSMPGRDVLVADLNHDGYLDLVAAFQRWGLYIYYGDGRGGFSGGTATFRQPAHTPEWLALADINEDGHQDLAINGNFPTRGQANGPDVYLGDGRGGWRVSSDGLKVLRFANAGIAVGDLDRDGHLDVVAGGNVTGNIRDGFGLFWFRGDGKGGWSLVEDCGLPPRGLSLAHGIGLADLDRDSVLEVVLLAGGNNGSITIWKRGPAPSTSSSAE